MKKFTKKDIEKLDEMLFLFPTPVRIVIDMIFALGILFLLVLYPISEIARTGYCVWMDYVLVPFGILLTFLLTRFANEAMKRMKK